MTFPVGESEIKALNGKLPFGVNQRRCRQFDGIEAEQYRPHEFAVGANAGEVDIGGEVPLAHPWDVVVIVSGAGGFIGPHIVVTAKHAAGAIAHCYVEPRRELAVFEE